MKRITWKLKYGRVYKVAGKLNKTWQGHSGSFYLALLPVALISGAPVTSQYQPFRYGLNVEEAVTIGDMFFTNFHKLWSF